MKNAGVPRAPTRRRCCWSVACSHLAMRGDPARSFQELADHQDLKATLQYMHLTEGAKDQAIALLEAA